MRGQGPHVFGVVAPRKDSAVNLGVQRLQPAAHHFRKAGIVGDVADRDPFALQVPPRSAGAVDLHAGRGQTSGKAGKAQLVAHTDDRALDPR